jgi:hypothetical protein
MMAGKLTIELTPAEQELLDQLELDAGALKGQAMAARNGERAAKLTELLLARQAAIPPRRIAYFTQPEYCIGGRGKSYKELFERNLRQGSMLEHPHFLAYLRYFIHGPDLPESVIDAFAAKVGECGHVTSSDIVPLAKYARQLARSCGLDPRDASEEFYKLALEHGLDSGYAEIIRKQVRTIR